MFDSQGSAELKVKISSTTDVGMNGAFVPYDQPFTVATVNVNPLVSFTPPPGGFLVVGGTDLSFAVKTTQEITETITLELQAPGYDATFEPPTITITGGTAANVPLGSIKVVLNDNLGDSPVSGIIKLDLKVR